jgi:diguanylate cyclase (GGDEF)-like protein
LAIVDYRLPGLDGISWIQQIRNEGFTFPIVFLSGQWCDAQTFNKLRNLLRVGLILQKPIVPGLFMEQIENLLPVPQKRATAETIPEPPPPAPPPPVAAPARASQTVIVTPPPPKTPDPPTDTHARISALMAKELKHPPAVELALQAAKQDYAAELPKEMKALAQSIRDTREAGKNKSAFHAARQHCHKLKGSAGSYGFSSVSQGVGKIENLLRSLESGDSTMQELLWSEIIRILAETESAANAAVKQVVPRGEAVPEAQALARHVIFISADRGVREAVTPLAQEGVCDVTICDGTEQAVRSAKQRRPDVIFVDLNACSKEKVPAFLAGIRSLPDCRHLPLALIADDQNQLGASESLYMGSSETVQKPAGNVTFSTVVQRLLAARESFMPRILTVDDDEMLCKFIKTVLQPQGYVVQALSEPIKILETLDAFAPDLVLLDVMMPALSGYDVCRLIKEHEDWKDLRVLFITSKSSPEGRASAFRAGGDDFLAKPVVTEELSARVRGQLDRSSSLDVRFARDPLTGALQRAPFESTTEAMVQLARQKKTLLTLVLIDVEKLRERTAQYGVKVTQTVLFELGKLVQARFRAEDVRARLGDFIVLVLPNKDGDSTRSALDLMQEEFGKIKFDAGDGSVFRNTLKFGIAQLWRDCDDAPGLIQAASTALFNH